MFTAQGHFRERFDQQLPKCPRPAQWCTHAGAEFREVDCRGDGVKGDLVCTDAAGHTGMITRESGCVSDWPRAELCGAAHPKCPRPQGWCTHAGSKFQEVDCRGDGVFGDLVCTDAEGHTGMISRDRGCKPEWPHATLCRAADPQRCARPPGWCTHAGARFREVDCRGDGVKGDLVCEDDAGRTGMISRDSGCANVWPSAQLCGAANRCARPEGWCSHAGSHFREVDCRGDGVAGDLECTDPDGLRGMISRNSGCTEVWPFAERCMAAGV
jgi:hypothetical protein